MRDSIRSDAGMGIATPVGSGWLNQILALAPRNLAMKLRTLRDLFIDQLRDLYSAEN
jgi:hypothetical protein